MKNYFFTAVFMLYCVSAYAQDGKTDKYGVVENPVLADTSEKFTPQAERVRDDMKVGGRYAFIKSADKQRVEARLDQMASLLQRYGSVDAMHLDTKVELFNHQEEINSLLKHNDINRLVCDRRAPTGSNIPVTRCRTLGDIELGRRAQEKALIDLNNLNRHQTINGGGGGGN